MAATGGPVNYPLIDQLTPAYKALHCVGSGASEMCDLYPAFAQAQADCDANPPRPRDAVGCVIILPQGDYDWSQAPTLCRGHRVVGQGGDPGSERTILHSAENVGCFRLADFDECDDGNPFDGPGTSDGATLEEFSCQGTITTTSSPVYGIDNDSGAHLRRLTIRGYVVGVRIDATAVTTGTAANANRWRMDDLHIWNNEHVGVMIRGPDTNAGLSVALDLIDNCKDLAWEATLGPCAHLRDRSFLGNTHVAPHAELTAGLRPSYLIDGDANQQTTLINPYAEGNTGLGTLSPNSASFGVIGRTFTAGGGLWFRGRNPSGMIFTNASDPNNIVQLWLGEFAVAGSAWDATAVSVGGGAALRLKSRLGNGGRWAFNPNNLSLDSITIQMLNDGGASTGDVTILE